MQQRQRRATAALDDSPIARLYQQHALSLMSYVRRHVPLREDAEDIVLEVFLAALEQKGLARLSEPEQLAWLRRIAHHKFVDYHRRSTRRPAVPLDEAAESLLMDEEIGPDQFALRREEDAFLRERFALLPEHYQTILLLRFARGLRCTEIAQRLNKSDGAVRMLLSRALNILREIYAKSEGGKER